MCVSTASCVCFYGRELQLKLAGVRVDDQVGCAPAHQQTVQMPRKLRQEKTHLSLRFCSPAPPEPPKKASPLRSMPATRVTRPCVFKQRHCTKHCIHAHVTSRVSIHVCDFVHCVCVCAIYVRMYGHRVYIETTVPANTEAALRTMSLLLTCSSSTTALAALTTTHPVKHLFTMCTPCTVVMYTHTHTQMHGAVSCEGYGPLCTPLSSSAREASHQSLGSLYVH